MDQTQHICSLMAPGQPLCELWEVVGASEGPRPESAIR